MPIRLTTSISALCALSALLASCASKPAPEHDAASSVDAGARSGLALDAAPRESLRPATRELLKARMQRHGTELTQLMSMVVLLDWSGVERASERLIGEPALARPLPGDRDSFNAELPALFFVRQQALLDALRGLRDAARHQSDHELKVAFNGVSGACLDCHAAYLSPSAQPDVLREPPL